MKATIGTHAGKRELARRTRALRLEWKAALEAADRIARGKPPLLAADGINCYPIVEVNISANVLKRQQHQQQPTAALVAAPFVRFLWSVHRSTTAAASNAAAAVGGNSSGVGVEPSELKYLDASLRQTLVGLDTRRAWGGEVRSQMTTS